MLNKINQPPEDIFRREGEKDFLQGENNLLGTEKGEVGPKEGECWCSCNTCDIYNSHCHNSLTGCRAPKHIRP